jgi:hypothetical protein
MGLSTDSIFIYALSASEDIVQAVDGRIYGTAIPLPDEEADNVPVPYIIVTFNGLNNIDETKDDMYESDYDSVNIGIEVIGKTLGHLHDLTEMVRNVIHQYFVQNETPVEGYQFSAQPIIFDSEKPCYWQVLNYQCEVYNHEINDEQDD